MSDLLPTFDVFYNLHSFANMHLHPHIVIGRMKVTNCLSLVHVLSPAIDPTGVPIAGGFIT